MNIVVSPEYEHLREWLSAIDELMVEGGCAVLHNGRNRVVLCKSPAGEKVVIKKYKRHDIIKKIAYTFFKNNKARSAYENAVELRKRGFETPREIAYIEKRDQGLITQVYFVSAYLGNSPISEQLSFDKELAEQYAIYVASLHSKGVLHVDLNSTNVLFAKDSRGYRFSLIDINRMRFYEKEVSKVECMENLALFWQFDEVYKRVLEVYAGARGWSGKDIDTAIRVKQRHDKRWIRKKRISRFFKSLFGK